MKAKKIVEVLLRKLPQDATLVIDNLSRLGEYLVSYLEQQSGHKPLQIQDWNFFVMYLREFMDLISQHSAKCNVIVIAHEQVYKDELTGAIERTIFLPTSMRHRVPSVVGEFWYLKADVKGVGSARKQVRILQNIPDRVTACGSRSWMPDIEEPTYEKMKPYLEKALGRTLPPATWTPKEG